MRRVTSVILLEVSWARTTMMFVPPGTLLSVVLHNPFVGVNSIGPPPFNSTTTFDTATLSNAVPLTTTLPLVTTRLARGFRMVRFGPTKSGPLSMIACTLNKSLYSGQVLAGRKGPTGSRGSTSRLPSG